MVDWRKIPKIDAHIHLTPKDVIDANIDYMFSLFFHNHL